MKFPSPCLAERGLRAPAFIKILAARQPCSSQHTIHGNRSHIKVVVSSGVETSLIAQQIVSRSENPSWLRSYFNRRLFAAAKLNHLCGEFIARQ